MSIPARSLILSSLFLLGCGRVNFDPEAAVDASSDVPNDGMDARPDAAVDSRPPSDSSADDTAADAPRDAADSAMPDAPPVDASDAGAPCAVDGVLCDDGNPTTRFDFCHRGTCAGYPAVDSCSGSCMDTCATPCCSDVCLALDCPPCGPGCLCIQACGGAECQTECQPGSHCYLDSRSVKGEITCDDASCRIDCGDSALNWDCMMTCMNGATCEMHCGGVDDCEIDCRDTSSCLLDCSSFGGFCQFLFCDAPVTCSPTVMACNRPCP